MRRLLVLVVGCRLPTGRCGWRARRPWRPVTTAWSTMW